MRRLLLTVEERFFAPNQGLLLIKPWLIDLAATDSSLHAANDWWPSFPRAPSPRPDQVEALRPDGSTLRMACRFADAHLNWIDHRSDEPPGFKPPWVVQCGLLGVSLDDIPPGSQLWYETDVPATAV